MRVFRRPAVHLVFHRDLFNAEFTQPLSEEFEEILVFVGTFFGIIFGLKRFACDLLKDLLPPVDAVGSFDQEMDSGLR